MKTLVLCGLGGLIALAVLVAFLVGAPEKSSGQRRTVSWAFEQVPAARNALAFRGRGFSSTRQGFRAEEPLAKAESSLRTLNVQAPARADGTFRLMPHRSSGSGVNVHLSDARPGAGTLEQGVLSYADAYPGVDVLASRDPERFELAYVVRDDRILPRLAIDLDVGKDGQLAMEPDTGAVLVRAPNGRSRLRIERPVALDGQGTTRAGSWSIEGGAIRLALDTSGLTRPFVIDPAFSIPFFTLLSDARQPGSSGYTANRISRETQLAASTHAGKPWLIRPVRSQQPEDRATHFGTIYSYQGSPFLLSAPRVPGSNGGPLLSAEQLIDWNRTFFAESETWEWSGVEWRLVPHSGLAGLVDPTLIDLPATGKMVVLGGATPEFHCGLNRVLSLSDTVCSADASSLENSTAIHENDGSGWVKKKVIAPPSPRVRAAASAFGTNVLLFGGRSVLATSRSVVFDRALDAPFPDNVTGALLSDTWMYDGQSWRMVPVSNPPPARESAQLLFDTRRQRAVLVGGNVEERPVSFSPGIDTFALWEFDGTDWLQRFAPGDLSLPPSLQTRRNMVAVWSPARRSTLLFGGQVDVLDSCPFSGADLAARRTQAQTDAALLSQLLQQGCMPGYAHDVWEWDGTNLQQLTRAAFGATDSALPSPQVVYQQVSGLSAATPLVAAVPSSTISHLWPFRYDPTPGHFRLRSALERAYFEPGPTAAPRTQGGSAQVSSGSSAAALVSPVFGAAHRPQAVVDPSTGHLLIFAADTGRIFDTDFESWTERTPSTSPFAAGQNDFVGATWDSTRQRAVVFDPLTGLTWENDGSGRWSQVPASGSPGIWSVNSGVRKVRDLDALPARNVVGILENAIEIEVRSMPRMTFDRGRGRTVMIYRDALWEYDGTGWQQQSLPAALTSCTAAILVSYDGQREKTVAVGCQVPAQTWEWDGTAWSGPFASPFQAMIKRGVDGLTGVPSIAPLPSVAATFWKGTLELPWAHPNALFESPTLGGLGIIDADGTLRVWNGSAWTAGPVLPQGFLSKAASIMYTSGVDSPVNYGVPYDQYAATDYDYVPLATFPPVIENTATKRLLAFRDGIKGLLELRLDVAPETRAWKDAFVGRSEGVTQGSVINPLDTLGYWRVYPHPFELLSPEHIKMTARANPNGRTDWAGQPRSSNFYHEATINNLFWPFRLLSDPVSQRVFVLTHRGALWELGSEAASARGEHCASTNDCAEGVCADGVCCDSPCAGLCVTCNGATPGTCQAVASGQPNPKNRCGAGECAQACSGQATLVNGNLTSTCSFPTSPRACGGQPACSNGALTPRGQCQNGANVCLAPTGSQPCPRGLGCADGTSCRSTCSARTDCVSGLDACSSDGTACVPDSATTLAVTRGIAPLEWRSPRVRTAQEFAALLRQAGFEQDDAGRILFADQAFGGVTPIFDPNLRTPMTGLRSCVYRLQACALANNAQVDQCVAGTPRCAGDTPWLGDPGGDDCCPEACLAAYLEARATESSFTAFRKIIDGACYPGLAAFTQELRQ